MILGSWAVDLRGIFYYIRQLLSISSFHLRRELPAMLKHVHGLLCFLKTVSGSTNAQDLRDRKSLIRRFSFEHRCLLRWLGWPTFGLWCLDHRPDNLHPFLLVLDINLRLPIVSETQCQA